MDVIETAEELIDDTSGKVAIGSQKNWGKKVSVWFKDPWNVLLFVVLGFAIVLRLYYFLQTMNQAFWWDEACYGILAKSLVSSAFDTNPLVVNEWIIRSPLLAVLWSVFMLLSLPEAVTRFFLEFLPSVISVFFVYLIGKEVFNKRVGVFAAFIFGVLWIQIFYTMRLLTDVPAPALMFVSIYFFIRGTKEKLNYKFYLVSMIFLSLAALMKTLNAAVFFIYLFVLIFKKQLYLNKAKFWVYSLIGVSPVLLMFLLNLIFQGSVFPSLGKLGADMGEVSKPIAWGLLSWIKSYLMPVFFWFFVLGGILILFELILGYDRIFKEEKYKNYLILILVFVFFFGFFIFYLRSADDRYFIPAAASMVLFAGYGLDYLYKLISKYHKQLALIVVLGVLVFGAMPQIEQADSTIRGKIMSFAEIKAGLEWLRPYVSSEDLVVASGLDPYAIYYADLNISSGINENNTYVLDDADYVIMHAFPGENPLIQDYIIKHQGDWSVMNAWFYDEQKTQAVLVIYQRVQ